MDNRETFRDVVVYSNDLKGEKTGAITPPAVWKLLRKQTFALRTFENEARKKKNVARSWTTQQLRGKKSKIAKVELSCC